MGIKIVLAGPRGKMGMEAIKMISNEKTFQLVACIDRKNNGKSLHEINSECNLNLPIYDDADICFHEIRPDVFVDLTVPNIGYEHTKMALEHKIYSVVGTSGFSQEQIDDLTLLAEQKNTG